jgi:hypothetical protein
MLKFARWDDDDDAINIDHLRMRITYLITIKVTWVPRRDNTLYTFNNYTVVAKICIKFHIYECDK